jgi:hypothetical protein
MISRKQNIQSTMSSSKELHAAMNSAEPGNQADAYQVIAAWEQAVTNALESGGGEQYRTIFWDHVEDVSSILIDAALTEDAVDWGFVNELIETYPGDGSKQPELPDLDIKGSLTDTAVTNVVGTAIAAQRTETDVTDLPTDGFEYLFNVARYGVDTSWEDATSIGWYYGHPDIDVEQRLITLAEAHDEGIFAPSTLEVGFVADEEAAIDVLEAFIEERIFHPGPNITHIDKAYTGRGQSIPRYMPERVADNIEHGIRDKNVAEIRDTLHDHIQQDFLAAIERERDLSFPLTVVDV